MPQRNPKPVTSSKNYFYATLTKFCSQCAFRHQRTASATSFLLPVPRFCAVVIIPTPNGFGLVFISTRYHKIKSVQAVNAIIPWNVLPAIWTPSSTCYSVRSQASHLKSLKLGRHPLIALTRRSVRAMVSLIISSTVHSIPFHPFHSIQAMGTTVPQTQQFYFSFFPGRCDMLCHSGNRDIHYSRHVRFFQKVSPWAASKCWPPQFLVMPVIAKLIFICRSYSLQSFECVHLYHIASIQPSDCGPSLARNRGSRKILPTATDSSSIHTRFSGSIVGNFEGNLQRELFCGGLSFT